GDMTIMSIKESEVRQQPAAAKQHWRGFAGDKWKRQVNVRDFIIDNVKPYHGDDQFLAGPTDATVKLWAIIQQLSNDEIKNGGVLDVDTHTVSTITSHGAGYLDQNLETI